MAIAFRAVGTTLKADVSLTGSPQSVGMPAGHVANDLLILTVVTDDNTGPDTPSGWTKLTEISPGTSTSSPYAGYPRTNIFYRIDTGALGSSVSVGFNTGAWPGGDPYVLAAVAAWSGCDTVSPIGEWNTAQTNSTTASQNHPQITTALVNSVLLSIRSSGADSAKTFTISGGTNTERLDDSHGSPAAPSFALYDTAALTAGLQTQRNTTASATVQYGSCMISIAIRPAPVASGAVALAGTAGISMAAQDVTAGVVIGPWDLCGAGGLPDYRLGIDWNRDGSIDLTGRAMNTNPYLRTDASDWTASNATVVRSTDFSFPTLKMTSAAGASPRVESGQQAAVTGQTYRAIGWVYVPVTIPSTAEVNINWYNGSHSYLSTSNNILTPVAGQWTYFDKTFTAPASTGFATVLMSFTGTPGAGYVMYGYGLLLVDPSSSASLMAFGPGEDITSDEIEDVVISYGRDQNRQLSPGALGSATARLCNVDRAYSPENAAGPLYGNLDPAREARFQVTWATQIFPLFRGRVDDFNVAASFSDRTASFSFLDGMALLQGLKLSTAVYPSLRTGDVINTILDEAGWTAPRDIDLGATIVKYWWAEGTDALSAIQDIVKSEGPPAVAYVAPDGTFTFHDRHHRLQSQASRTSQGTYAVAAIGCAAPAATGFSVGEPFTYEHGWRDIVNSVEFEVSERVVSAVLDEVWTSEDTYTLAIGQSIELDISTSDPFVNAVTPVAGTDFTVTGAGTVNAVLSRTSGQAVRITLLAVGGAVIVTGLRLRAQSIPVLRTIKVSRMDTGSISEHGERSYPETAPWANANDAEAIANMILLHYAQRRPTVQLRVHTQNPSHFLQVLQRTISDRVHIRHDELGLDDDFFVERVTHTIQRINKAGAAPVHSVVLGCEKQLELVSNPFTFDKRGAGFDQGVFDPISADDADTVFIFDDPTQGQFDVGLFGT